jgi:hypothetical protein
MKQQEKLAKTARVWLPWRAWLMFILVALRASSLWWWMIPEPG